MAIIQDRKMTQNEFDSMTAPLELDLLAFFRVLRDQVMEQTFDDTREPEVLIDDILAMFDEPIEDSVVAKEDRPVGCRFFQGMLIGVENPAGTVRSGTDPNGHRWSIEMNYDYGYIWNTSAVDGDSIDAYLGPNEKSDKVYVVRQVDPDTKEFDEVKVMLGFSDQDSAILAYRSQYDDPRFFGGIKEYELNEFKSKIFGGSNANAKAG